MSIRWGLFRSSKSIFRRKLLHEHFQQNRFLLLRMTNLKMFDKITTLGIVKSIRPCCNLWWLPKIKISTKKFMNSLLPITGQNDGEVIQVSN